MIAKRADSAYVSTRSRDWLKFKCQLGQELVIGGYTAPKDLESSSVRCCSVISATGELEYAGKVGTGFDTDTLRSLGAAAARPCDALTRRSPIRARFANGV